MKHQRPIAPHIWLTALAACLLLAGTLALHLWPRTVPLDQCSATYRRYAGRPDIDAAYIGDYRINDSVKVAVTVLEAKTDSAWAALLQDFNTIPPPKEFIDITGGTGIEIWAAPKKDYSSPMDTILLNNDLIAATWSEHSLSIFSIENTEQMLAVQHSQYKKSISISKKTKNEQNN